MDRFAKRADPAFRKGATGADQPVRLLSRAGAFGRTFALILFTAAWVHGAERIAFKPDDIVAFVGGADVAAAQHTGHLESLLALAHPTVRFRNFGWEGDTVFAQPRDYNFPPLPEHIGKSGATIIFIQFGRMEAFADQHEEFRAAYEKSLDTFAQITPRLVLVTPIPFEHPPAPLPDLSARNPSLGKITATIKDVARQRNLPVVDLFSRLKQQNQNFTEDGLQLTPSGHAIAAIAFAKELGLDTNPKLAENATWQARDLESLRQLIIAKNRLWFDYWRPQNWAFLGGDRIEQPSSRDHRDPKIRWFPQEMEKFQALISSKENEITTLARAAEKR